MRFGSKVEDDIKSVNRETLRFLPWDSSTKAMQQMIPTARVPLILSSCLSSLCSPDRRERASKFSHYDKILWYKDSPDGDLAPTDGNQYRRYFSLGSDRSVIVSKPVHRVEIFLTPTESSGSPLVQRYCIHGGYLLVHQTLHPQLTN